jgi:hypothetical protein
MSGMVFHPGHQELHGVTVVVDGTDGRTYVGRFDREDERGVLLFGVSVWDPATAHQPVEEFLARTLKFGVQLEFRQLVLPSGEVQRIRRLAGL